MALAMWPQYVVGGLTLLGMGLALGRYGQPKRDSYDLWDLLIGPALVTWLLYMGGFWTGCQ